jgi:hypothetical protein
MPQLLTWNEQIFRAWNRQPCQGFGHSLVSCPYHHSPM